MPIQTHISLSLEKFNCTREDDGFFAGSEPYIWPALIAFNTLDIGEQGQAFPSSDHARLVIKDGIESGTSASIPPEVGNISLTITNAAAPKYKILVLVLLFEADANTPESMRAGYEEFKLRLLGELLIATVAGTQDPTPAAIEQLKSNLSDKITAAVKSKLSSADKVKIGLFGQDEMLGAEFVTRPGRNSDIFLEFGTVFSPERFSIQGRLTVQPEEPVEPERCPQFVLEVNKARAAVQRKEQQLRAMQAEMRIASPLEKPGLLAEIEEFRDSELAAAVEALDAAREALAACRARSRRDTVSPNGPIVVTQ
jgi:hypothetical protein